MGRGARRDRRALPRRSSRRTARRPSFPIPTPATWASSRTAAWTGGSSTPWGRATSPAPSARARARPGLKATVGKSLGFDPEAIVHARFIVAWGANIVSSNVHLWPFIEEARRRGARFVAVDPYRSRTAEKADHHLALLPGTDAALALGVMHVLFRDGLRGRRLPRAVHGRGRGASGPRRGVDARAHRPRDRPHRGRDRGLRARVRHHASLGDPPQLRAEPPRRRRAWRSAPSPACPRSPGDWRHVGGGVLLSTSGTFPIDNEALERPDLAAPGTRTLNMSQLGRVLTDPTLAPPVKALFVYNSNPAAVAPEQEKVREGLGREDLFTVVHELFSDRHRGLRRHRPARDHHPRALRPSQGLRPSVPEPEPAGDRPRGREQAEHRGVPSAGRADGARPREPARFRRGDGASGHALGAPEPAGDHLRPTGARGLGASAASPSRTPPSPRAASRRRRESASSGRRASKTRASIPSPATPLRARASLRRPSWPSGSPSPSSPRPRITS